MILEEMVKMFLDSRKRGVDGARKKCRPKTVDVYRANLDIFLGFLQSEVDGGGITQYKSVRRVHIMQFVDWMEAKQKAGEWSRATVLQILRTLRAFFHWVDRDEDCQLHELKGMHKYLPTIERTPRRTDIPQLGDLKKFKNSFNTDSKWGFRDYVAVSLMMTNGLRIGELCNLTVECCRLEEKTLIVTGKTGTRLVPITTEMVRLLKGWLKRRNQCATAAESPYVFVSKRSPRMEPTGFAHKFSNHRKKFGLPRISPHTFRHAFCTHYLKAGGDIKRLKDITGHSSFNMLFDYLQESSVGSRIAQDELEKVNMLKD